MDLPELFFSDFSGTFSELIYSLNEYTQIQINDLGMAFPWDEDWGGDFKGVKFYTVHDHEEILPFEEFYKLVRHFGEQSEKTEKVMQRVNELAVHIDLKMGRRN